MRAALLALLVVACSSPSIAPRDCTPGTTSACVCPGASGVQTCTAEGRVGACVCADAGMVLQDAGELPDAPPATDRSELPDVATARDAGLEDAAEARADAPPAATDAATAGDAQVSCEGPIPRRCSSSAHCQAMCLPSGVNRLPWCCTPGGECIPNLTSNVCPWR